MVISGQFNKCGSLINAHTRRIRIHTFLRPVRRYCRCNNRSDASSRLRFEILYSALDYTRIYPYINEYKWAFYRYDKVENINYKTKPLLHRDQLCAAGKVHAFICSFADYKYSRTAVQNITKIISVSEVIIHSFEM